MSNVESNTWKARVLAAMAFEREERDRRWRDCGVRAAAAHDAVVALLDEAVAHWDAAPADPQPAVAEVLVGYREASLCLNRIINLVDPDDLFVKDEGILPVIERMVKRLDAYDRAAAKVAQHFERAAHRTPGQYRCKVCGARWELLSGSLDWTLRSERCGPCCDNAPMDEQIEPVSAAPIAEELLLAADELLASFRDDMPADGTTIPNQKVQALRDAVAAARCAPHNNPEGRTDPRPAARLAQPALSSTIEGEAGSTPALGTSSCNPTRAPVAETAWLLEMDCPEDPRWFKGKNGDMWTRDANEAIRFSRREDACRFRRAWHTWGDLPSLVGVLATEHVFGLDLRAAARSAPAQAPAQGDGGKLRRLREWVAKDGERYEDSHGIEVIPVESVHSMIDRLLAEPASEPCATGTVYSGVCCRGTKGCDRSHRPETPPEPTCGQCRNWSPR